MGIFDLGPFRRTLTTAQKELERAMAKAAGASTLAVLRTTVELMEADLRKGEAALKPFTVSSTGGTPANNWRVTSEIIAVRKLFPEIREPRQYASVVKEYEALAAQLKTNVQKTYRFLFENDFTREVWIVRRNLPTRQVIDRIALALDDYRQHHEPDDDFLFVLARQALDRMLTEDRLDLGIALRVASQIPNDIETFVLEEKDRESWTAVASLVIGFIPIIGNAVALFEVWRGKDIFGNELSDAERAIIGASVLLPAAGRLVKAGKSLYTAERMARLYGEDARWAQIMGRAERLSAEAADLRRLREAELAAAGGARVSRTAAERLQEVFKRLGLDSSGRAVVPSTIDQKLVEVFEQVVLKHPKLKELDALAVQRIVGKGKLVKDVKAQIQEELLEDRIVKLLRDPLGRHALGLGHVKGSLYFIPGHLIRDELALQLTDGIIIRYVKDRLQAVAVFEAKSGAASAEKLVLRSGKLSKATKAERLAKAREGLGELHERARLAGLPPPKTTVDDLVKQMISSELGGQFRSDIERLAELKVWVNGVELPVELQSGPVSTKWFGVLPSDVDGAALVQSLRNQAKDPKRIINVEMMGMDITSSELTNAAEFLIKKAAQLAKP